MNNELDGRLGRLEVALAGQRTMLDAQSVQLERIYAILAGLLARVTEPEPDGPSLSDLIAQLIAAIGHNGSLSVQILAALERLKIG